MPSTQRLASIRKKTKENFQVFIKSVLAGNFRHLLTSRGYLGPAAPKVVDLLDHLPGKPERPGFDLARCQFWRWSEDDRDIVTNFKSAQ
jgi:hypothetical protein